MRLTGNSLNKSSLSFWIEVQHSNIGKSGDAWHLATGNSSSSLATKPFEATRKFCPERKGISSDELERFLQNVTKDFGAAERASHSGYCGLRRKSFHCQRL